MTKQEKIQEAYGTSYEELQDLICENGWVSYIYERRLWDRGIEEDRKNNMVRPKSLSGIENNNGWIKVESDSDLPKDEGQYWVHNEKMNQTVYSQFDFELKFRFGLGHTFPATHYQPIEKPKTPIY